MKRTAVAFLLLTLAGAAYAQFGPGAGQSGIGGCGPMVGGGPQAGSCGAPMVPGGGGSGGGSSDCLLVDVGNDYLVDVGNCLLVQ